MSNEKDMLTLPSDYTLEILEIIQSNLNASDMTEALLDYHEKDIATAIARLDIEQRQKFYDMIDVDTLADVLEYVDDLSTYLSELSDEKRVDILSLIDASVAVEYLEELDKQEFNEVSALMPTEVQEEIALLTSFDKDEIGSQMTTNYIAILQSSSIRVAMSELIKQAADNDNVSTIYVVDENDVFVGAIDLKDLIRARAEIPLEDIIMTSYPHVYADEPTEECFERLKSYCEDSIPVLDRENKLIGVLSAQDIAQIVEDEIGDDYAKLGGLTEEEEANETLIKSIGKRLPWLIALFGLGLMVSSVVGVFDGVVAQLPLLVSFQSLILGMAGNVGTQSLAVTIRSLMDDGLTRKEKLLLMGKEARVGLFNGLILGSTSFILIGIYLYALKKVALPLSFSVSLCIGIALTLSMLLSSIFGTTIPIFFKKIKIDPAVASGPFITTVNDLVAVLTYYGLAWFLLIHGT